MFGGLISTEYLILGMGALCILCLILAIVALCVAVAMKHKYEDVMVDGAGKDITEAIITYYDKCEDLIEEFEKAEGRIATLEKNIKLCGQKIGCYRYNAFEENKGNLSFALAVLDAENTGYVLDGFVTRERTATYMKLIEKGVPQSELTQEEEEALRLAVMNYQKQMGNDEE